MRRILSIAVVAALAAAASASAVAGRSAKLAADRARAPSSFEKYLSGRKRLSLSAPRNRAVAAQSGVPMQDAEQRVAGSPLVKNSKKIAPVTDKESALMLENILDDINSLRKEGGVKVSKSLSRVFATVVGATSLSFVAPYVFSHAVAEYLITGMAATILTCAGTAEFQGRGATADAKEVAAVALAQAARAEAYLSRAEKARAIMPAMVGTSATAATLCLIYPALMEEGVNVNPLFVAACPIIATSAAAWGAAALIETLAQGLLALGQVSTNRILSVREADTPELRQAVFNQRVQSILKSTLPGIVVGLLLPRDFVDKCILSSAVAAVMSAYNFAEAEAVCAEVTLKVAAKAKASASAEVFANQASAESAILPFTSATAGIGLALSAAVVEFEPLIANMIPMMGAVATGVSTTAAQKSKENLEYSRMAFNDSKLKKVAPTREIPDLAFRVIPELMKLMLYQGATVAGGVLRDGLRFSLGGKVEKESADFPPNGPETVPAKPAELQKVSIKNQAS